MMRLLEGGRRKALLRIVSHTAGIPRKYSELTNAITKLGNVR